MPIEAVLFDYSGVLTTPLTMPVDDVPYDPEALFVEMAHGLSTTEPHPWHELERGEISLAAFISFVEETVPGAGVLFAADSDLNVMGSLELIADRLALVAETKAAGFRVGVVTNNVAEWRPLWSPRLPGGVFDIVLDSAEVGCRKPEAAMYELALAELGFDDAASVVFIDDFEWNVAGADDAGMVALHCTPATDLRAELRVLLGEVLA